MKRYLLFILMGCLSLQFVSAKVISETFRFDKDSLSKEFVININSKCSEFNVEIEGRLMRGQFKLELLSPDGKVQENLSLDATDALDKNHSRIISNRMTSKKMHEIQKEKLNANADYIMYNVLGLLNKKEYNPQTGYWMVRMTPKNAEADIKVNYSIK